MSLQKRLLIYLLIGAPLVWAAATYLSVQRARYEVDELFDSEMIRFARQMRLTLGAVHADGAIDFSRGEPVVAGTGRAALGELAVAVWDARGERVLADSEGVQLPPGTGRVGFVDQDIGGVPWRTYYLVSADHAWQIATGQKLEERRDVSLEVSGSQLLPWLLMLPLLLLAMAWAVRRALAPVRQMAGELGGRDAHDLRPLGDAGAPAELQPIVTAVNGLLTRMRAALERERRFTADAAHELRTPLAVLRAQWDVVRRAGSSDERRHAETQLGAGLDRIDRLVTQMLALSRVEASTEARDARPEATQTRLVEIDWRAIVEQAVGDCLPLAGRRRIEMAADWPEDAPGPGTSTGTGTAARPFPLRGDPALLTVMLRNLLDNAIRYAPAGSLVQLRIDRDALEVENGGVALPPEQLSRLGERFYRPEGQEEGGSGLGVSIVQRIAALHRLAVRFEAGPAGRGLRVRVARTAD